MKILLIIFFTLFIVATAVITRSQTTQTKTPITPESIFEQVNDQRVKANLQPLVHHPDLMKSATWKLTQICETNQFSHDIKTMSWKEFFVNVDPTLVYISENLAKGQPDTESVVRMWMDSPTHKSNILRSELTHTGIATKDCNSKSLMVQHFGGGGDKI